MALGSAALIAIKRTLWHTLKMNTRILIGASIAIIIGITLSDLNVLRYGIYCISELNGATEFETFGLSLCIGNLLFKLTGIILAIIGLIEISGKSERLNLKLKLLLIYTAVALILALPLYHRHPGFGGPGTHGHSFWDGGLHFH